MIFAALGALTVSSSRFDVWMTLGFGALGCLTPAFRWPMSRREAARAAA